MLDNSSVKKNKKFFQLQHIKTNTALDSFGLFPSFNFYSFLILSWGC